MTNDFLVCAADRQVIRNLIEKYNEDLKRLQNYLSYSSFEKYGETIGQIWIYNKVLKDLEELLK